MPNKDFRVSDMSCGSCVATVTRTLLGVTDVSEVRVDLERGQVAVGTQGAAVDALAVVSALKAAGYTAVPMDADQRPGLGCSDERAADGGNGANTAQGACCHGR